MMKYSFTHAVYMTDNEIGRLYELLRDQGLYDAIFYARLRPARREWLDWVGSKENWFVRVTDERMQVVGIFWLDGFRDMTAYVHFASFRELGTLNTTACGRQALAFMEDNLQGSVNALLGFMPTGNRAGQIFQKRLGFKRFMFIQDAIKLHTGGTVDATLSVYNFNRGV